MDERKNDRIVRLIENFVETKNRYLQVFLILTTVTVGAVYGFVPDGVQTILRYTLILDLFMEIYILQAKDSITQGKLNNLLVSDSIQTGKLRYEKDIDIEKEGFFSRAENDFFFSGISPNHFMQNFQARFKEKLKKTRDLKYAFCSVGLKRWTKTVRLIMVRGAA